MDIIEVEQLQRQIEDDFEKDMAALKRVLDLLYRARERDAAIEKPFHKPAPKLKSAEGNGSTRGGRSRTRGGGVIGAALKVIDVLPGSFGRKQWIEAIHAADADMVERTTKDAMNGATERAIKESLIIVEQKGQGKRPAIYRKVNTAPVTEWGFKAND